MAMALHNPLQTATAQCTCLRFMRLWSHPFLERCFLLFPECACCLARSLLAGALPQNIQSFAFSGMPKRRNMNPVA